jgi:hypothetical protein
VAVPVEGEGEAVLVVQVVLQLGALKQNHLRTYLTPAQIDKRGFKEENYLTVFDVRRALNYIRLLVQPVTFIKENNQSVIYYLVAAVKMCDLICKVLVKKSAKYISRIFGLERITSHIISSQLILD